MLIETARDFARNELLPLDRKWDEDESTVEEILPTLGEMGLMNLTLPEELNGVGCSFGTYFAILHEIAASSPSTAVTISVHSMVGKILHECLAEPLRTEVLSSWGDPASFAAFALTEADAGSDARAARVEAVEVDGGLKINGEKMWITNGLTSRWFLTLVRLRDVPDNGSLCAVLIDGNDRGVERTKIHGKMGIRGSETAVIHFADTFVPEDHIVGQRGRGMWVFTTTLNEGRIGIASQSSGIAEACLSEMSSYVCERKQFGRPIGTFQAVARMVADSAVELEAAKALIWQAAEKVDAGCPSRSASSMAKLYASEAANRIAYRAVQAHGGTGYVRECRVEQLYRDARVTTIYEGTSEIQRLLIARELGEAS
ncbi:MAG: acyl-CoA dehydrogenase family protein [Phycisphaerales bacterium]|nr:MAG: acyl-CoA dehydrogenase family protein [Phycisphaerales bacterium]